MGHILKPRLGLRLNHNHPLSQGLVGCWVMNEGSGVPYDIINGHSPSILGAPLWEASPLGQSIFFDGEDDAYEYSHIEPYSLTTAITLLVKVKILSTTSQNYAAIVEKTKTTGSPYCEYSIQQRSAYDREWIGAINVNGTQRVAPVITNVPENQYLLAVLRWETGKTVEFRIYNEDGTLFGSTDTSSYSGAITSYNDVLRFGQNDASANSHVEIVYVNLYNRYLSLDEIIAHQQEPYAMFEPDTGIWLRYYEAGGGAIVKVINETLQFSESVGKSLATKKIINETLQLSESTLKLQDTKKVINETLQLSESIEKKGATKKVVNETLQFSETLLKKGSIKKVVNETLQLAENIVKKSGIIRIINEVLNISEGIIKALAVAYGWREVIEGDSPITLVVSGTSTITTEVTGNSTITTEITGNSPLN